MATLSIKIDDDVKKAAEAEFKAMGLSTSAAVNIYFRKVIQEHGIPFIPTSSRVSDKFSPKYTPQERREVVKKHLKRLKNENKIFEIKKDENGRLVVPTESMLEPELREAWVYEGV